MSCTAARHHVGGQDFFGFTFRELSRRTSLHAVRPNSQLVKLRAHFAAPVSVFEICSEYFIKKILYKFRLNKYSSYL